MPLSLISPEAIGSGPSLQDLLRKVTVTSKWRMIGVGLGITTDDLDAIQTRTAGLPNSTQSALEQVFITWQKTLPKTYSWRTLFTVLKSGYIGETRLAQDLEREFC